MAPGLRVGFAGSPDLAVRVLEKLIQNSAHRVCRVYTRPDKPAGRGRKLRRTPVKELAEALALPISQPANPAALGADRLLGQLDVLVVAAYSMILPPPVLSRPRFGCINVHTSLLPRWRGAAPIQRAILAGDTETGITIMQMDAGLDTGDILYQQSCPILADDTAGSLHDRLAVLGGECLVTVLDMLAQGTLRPARQDPGGVTYAEKISKEEARIDWQKPAEEIERQVRAFNPYPVAFTELAGKTIRVWQAAVIHRAAGEEPAGRVVSYTPEGIDITTADKVLRLLRVQLPGKKPVGARDFYNGNPALFAG